MFGYLNCCGVNRILVGIGLACAAFSAGAADKVAGPLGDAYDHALTAYQPLPDRYVVRAAEFIVQRMADVPTSESITLTPQPDKWIFSVAGKPLGELAVFATFDAKFSFLESIAKDRITNRPASPGDVAKLTEIDKALDAYLIDDILTASRTLDAMWRDNTAALPLKQAERASAYMYAQTFNAVGFKEAPGSRALAFLAAESALTSNSLTSEKALMAWMLGYDTEAKKMAETLPVTDYVRWLVMDDLNRIIAMAQKDDATTRTWHLTARKLATSSEQTDNLIALLKRRIQEINPNVYFLTVAPLIAQTGSWDDKVALGFSMGILQISGLTHEKLEKSTLLFPAFVKALESIKEDDTGPILDRDLRVAIHTANFQSSIDVGFTFLLNQFGSVDDARDLLKAMGSTDVGLLGQFSQLMDVRLQATTEKDIPKLQKQLEGNPDLNNYLSSRLFNKIESLRDGLMPELVRAALAYKTHLGDSPGELNDHVTLAREGFMDLIVLEKIKDSRVWPGSVPVTESDALLAYFREDTDTLLKMGKDENVEPMVRGKIICNLMRTAGSITTATRDQMMRTLIEAHPLDYEIVFYAVRYFEGNENYDEAIRIQTKYTDSLALKEDLSYAHARCRLADLYGAKNDYAKALEITKTVAESYTGDALINMAQYNIELGNYTEGIDWADKALDRYNDTTGVALKAFAYWKQGQYEQAAAAIKKHKTPLSSSDWRHSLTRYFLSALGDKPAAEREKAIAELVKIGYNKEFGEMGFYSMQKHRYDVAFEFNKNVRESGFDELRGAVVSYHVLALDKGTTVAMEWLGGRVPQTQRADLGGIAFRESAYELLDKLVPDDDGTSLGRYNWTLRAAAICHHPERTQEMAERVKAHFASGNASDFDYVAGEYLLGLKDASALAAVTKSDDEICRAACFIGLKYVQANDYRNATLWFRTSILSGRDNLNEYHKSRMLLANWMSLDRSVEVMPKLLETDPVKDLPGM